MKKKLGTKKEVTITGRYMRRNGFSYCIKSKINIIIKTNKIVLFFIYVFIVIDYMWLTAK